MRLFTLPLFILSFGLISCTSPDSTEAPYDRTQDSLRYDNEEHIRNIRQLTFGADNAEAYFGFGDEKIVFQSNNPDWGVGCDQIFYMDTSDKEENFMPKMISTGTGRTTCAFFLPGDTTFVYGSTHLDDINCPEVPERGPNGAYVWPIYDSYDIFKANLEGEIIDTLTNEPGYDAEATLSPDGKSIVFTSMRTGDLDIDFPNLENTHVSEATYYRLFLQEYIPVSTKFIMYMDADIVCINDPTSSIKKEINNLTISDKVISVKSEKIFDEYVDETIERLQLTQRNYFNAGVMLIDLNKWFNENLSLKLTNHLDSIRKRIKYWDQDVLNSYFDGQFIELSEFLNFKLLLNYENLHIDLVKNSDSDSKIKFIHYTGKYKPWTVKGALNVNTFFYHKYYAELFKSIYHIKDSRKLNSLKELTHALLGGSFFKSKYPIKLLQEITKSFFN